MTANLLLYWQLDDIAPGGIMPDYSERQLDGRVEGNPTVLPDEQFGACLLLDGTGDAVRSSGLPGFTAFTISAWVRLPPLTVSTSIVGRGTLNLRAGGKGILQCVLPKAGTGGMIFQTDPGVLTYQTWNHVAVTRDATDLRIYVNGAQVYQRQPNLPLVQARGELVLGREPENPGGYLTGAVAGVRVHDGALTAEEIRQLTAGDETTLGAFVRTYPLDFELANVDQQPVLYIDDGASSQTMTLRVSNSARHDITLWPLSGPVSATNHHLALRWRAGTLATISPVGLAATGWSMLATPDRTAFYLLGPASARIPAGTSVDLPLTGLRVDGTDGTRGTRVELGYRQLGYVRETSEITGTRQQVLEVVNHRGRPDIPLDIGFVDGDRVLSGGTDPSDLRLRVANISRDVAIPLAGPGTAGGESKLVLSFEVQLANESRTWALTDSTRAGSLTLELGGAAAGWEAPTRVIDDERVQWTLRPPADTSLAAGAWLDLTIRSIYGLGATGHAPVVLAYENIPGYQDGFVTAEVERAPLLFNAGRAGLGTAAPRARLHIEDVNSDGTQGSLIVGPTNQPNLRLGYHTTYAWVQSHGPSPLAINPVGNNVGIGTTTPPARLTVQAASDHLQLRRDEPTGGQRLFLELYQTHTGEGVITYPSIRFHHPDKFWNRIEGRPEGIAFKTGSLPGDQLVNVYAAEGHFTALRVGGVLITQRELSVLARLVATGQLR
ncbi:LamG domain-containing protein [Plantactinospora sp. WMMC1484]|uniref:LamG domain-containing protein n=1 Tax=Plantactinospora sp. WMMC1484 TaxID=3404122 RepID=UPI003BF58319